MFMLSSTIPTVDPPPSELDFVYVPVPRSRVLEIMRMLGSAYESTRPQVGSPPGEPTDLDEPATPGSRTQARDESPPTAERRPSPVSEASVERAAAVGDSADEAAEPPGTWTEEELRELVQSCPEKQLLVLQCLAQRAPEEVTAWELQEYLLRHRDISEISTDAPGRALGAIMAALKKRSKWWEDGRKRPFGWRWDGKRWENVYWMPEAHASPVLAALREHRPDKMGATG